MHFSRSKGKLSPYELFTVVYHKDTSSVLDLIRNRSLQPMDAAVLLYMVTKVNISTSRISVAASAISEAVGIKQTLVYTSLKRLVKEMVLGKGQTDGVAYYMLNPYYFDAGVPALHKKRVAAFNKLLA